MTIPNCAWKRPIATGWEQPYLVRYASNLDDGPWHGMPLGGFGAGCLGRSPAGDFNLWHIDGGEHCFQTIPACQFSIFEASAQGNQAYALGTPPEEHLTAWQWYPKGQGIYGALYPRSWFEYSGVFQAEITCEQFSPILPHNYQETSYPVALFVWKLRNPTEHPLTLSIMLTWQNLVGWFTNANKSPQVQIRDDGSPVYDYQPRWGESQGNFNQVIQTDRTLGWVLKGPRQISGQVAEGEGEWAVLIPRVSQAEFFYHGRWNPHGDGAEIWQTFGADGSLKNSENPKPAEPGEQVAAALAVRITLQPGESQEIPFSLAWDFPVTEFAEGIHYDRRYTDFFNRSGNNALAIAQDGLTHYQEWQDQIRDWQRPILERRDWPDWFKMALCNELYDLTSGGSLWTSATEADPFGQFAVLECLDYRWYESLDVRLYGSFALVMLWPELEKAVMRAFARAIPKQDPHLRIIGYFYRGDPETAHRAPRKLENAVPHDLGAPNEHPWEETNYTAYQDCNLWKDLASDFVLLVYRDFLFTGETDLGFLRDCWPAIVPAIAYLKTFDTDGDGLPENSGAPDQTYDDWQLKGMSAYCGGLWIAALEAAVAIAQILEAAGENIPEKATYETWLNQARPLYHNTLWNGQYYRLDSESGSPVVMADQLCGQFYARLLGLPDVVPEDCTLTALNTIYQVCFLGFHGGTLGVANGLLPDSRPEKPDATHPLEVWIGINFGLAAFYWQMGLTSEAWRITETVVAQIYENGLQFRTPEAITAEDTFRACMYLRPMAIWALAWVTGYPETRENN
ncbi:bile acid beta-glucosidase [Candidatus Synechococcus calcipolaris G9]|uniref:Bile acid beta-glucosidase n=1 Tax=Candidatus Synechococcus calcipolaris G9 TaxID=1497997 RepID=A0ABT6F0K3_9SYNE|nr:GH116 family glycosyl hydrolase [Candidatus Synechococcus calcipolaris]MDG2991389.1 bile acid beta-glucosidase [Candidatus Synechococcus calcipolaris G9]